MRQAETREINILFKKLDEACFIEFGTRIVQKKDGGEIYPVYGGGGATFKMDTYNRENCLVVSRFAMSKQCTRFVKGKFFLNDSGLTVRTKNEKELSQSYLDYFLLTLNDAIYSLSRGTAQRNLNVSKFRNLEISYPDSIELQLRIANILSKAENLIAQRKESIRLLDKFLKNTFLEMFGDTRHYTKSDIVKTIGEVCHTRGGGTPSKAKPEYYTGEIPWVSPKDMKWLYISTSQDKITQQAIDESSTALIPKGSLLMVIRSGILKSKLPLAINKVDLTINQDIKAFTSKEVSTEYLMYFFFSEERNILKKVKGTTADNLNFDDIKKMKIKIPPLELQTQFAQIVEKTEALKSQYQQSLKELEQLYGSLSQKAFKGELVKN